MQDIVITLYRCVVETQMKANFRGWCGPNEGAGSSGVVCGEGVTPARFGVAAGVITSQDCL